jgi:sugar phosphate isomerase/epimerase
MRIGASSLHLIGKPFSFLLKAIRTYDVDLWEIVDDDTHTLTNERVNDLNELKESLGIDYTVHSPFSDINIAAMNETFRSMTIERLTQSLHYARKIGALLWVFHPGIHSALSHFYPQRDMQNCVLSVGELSKVAEELEIPIVIENMPASVMFLLRATDEFDTFFEQVGKTAPDIVLDIGHANTTNEIETLLERQGGRVVHLHAHDNDGQADSHEGIGDGTVPWKVVSSKLSKLGFNGSVVVESVKHVPESIRSARELFL